MRLFDLEYITYYKKLLFPGLITLCLLLLFACDAGPNTPTPAATPGQHRTYRFINECPNPKSQNSSPHGAWHWKFQPTDGGTAIEVTILPGETRVGTIPLGNYQVSDWSDDGFVKPSITERTIDGQELQFNVSLCPDD